MTCRPVAGQRLCKHIPKYAGSNRRTAVSMQRAITTTIEEEVFSMWFAYIHCWATDVFSMRPPRDCISKRAPALQQETAQSVQAPHVSSQPLDNMLRVVTVVQQIMTEFSGAVSERDKLMAITKIV
jgi:hypothetical protein